MNKTPERHHYIPQFLLKGFASRITKKAHLVYRFARGAEPHEVNTINLAVARNFHDGLSADLEQRISFRESNYVHALEHLRGKNATSEDIGLIAECVFNLMVRTKHLRDGITIFGNEIVGLFDLPEAQRVLRNRALKNFIDAQPEIVAILSRYPKSRHQRILLTEMTKRGFDLNGVCRGIWDKIKASIDMSKWAKDAQLKVLDKDGLPEARRDSFLSYRWYIDSQPAGTFVLGDVGPLARVPDEVKLTLPYGCGTPLSVYLPISSAELLVGTAYPEREVIAADEVNRASAELSRDFFVASKNTSREQAYLQYIGARATLLSKPDMVKGFKEVLDEFERGKQN